ncbi:MAG: hypothetical protein JWL90_504 [Chthoniobacteraceae bacterium]|nr:hypothetical protein [Chthoniobacteraceae bacterium]
MINIMRAPRNSRSAFTLVEMVVAATIGVVVCGLTLSYMRIGTILFAKNIGTNFSNNELRGSLDRVADSVQSTVNVPVLIDTSAAPVSLGATGSGVGVYRSTAAAGVYYDRLLGEPYIVTHPGGTGLPSSTTTLKITISTNVFASPPVPMPGDVLIIDGAPASLRPLVKTVVKDAPDAAGLQSITVTFNAALGSSILWDVSRPKTSKLIRREALIVMPNGTRNELRRYPSFEPPVAAADLTNPAKYTVLTRQVGTAGGELTPFSLSTIVTSTSVAPDKLLNLDFRIRATGFEKVLSNKEVNDFSNFVRINTVIPSRLRPKN